MTRVVHSLRPVAPSRLSKDARRALAYLRRFWPHALFDASEFRSHRIQRTPVEDHDLYLFLAPSTTAYLFAPAIRWVRIENVPEGVRCPADLGGWYKFARVFVDAHRKGGTIPFDRKGMTPRAARRVEAVLRQLPVTHGKTWHVTWHGDGEAGIYRNDSTKWATDWVCLRVTRRGCLMLYDGCNYEPVRNLPALIRSGAL